jgi:hypothetical protein
MKKYLHDLLAVIIVGAFLLAGWLYLDNYEKERESEIDKFEQCLEQETDATADDILAKCLDEVD